MFLKITLCHFLLAESCSIVYIGLFFFIHLSPHKQYVYFHFLAIVKCSPVHARLNVHFKMFSSQISLGVVLQYVIVALFLFL